MNFLREKWQHLIPLFREHKILAIGDFVIILLIGLAMMFLLRYLFGLQLKRSAERIKQRFFMDAEAREIKAKNELKENGYKEKYSLFERIDALFKQAGYVKYGEENTTEMVLIKVSIVIIGISIFAGIIFRTPLAIIASIFICVAIFLAITYATTDKQYAVVEDEILRFINMADRYSSENDDIVYIIGKVYPEMKEPLYTYGRDFYYEAMHTGVDAAFLRFEERISHKKFREIIHNIHICSKNSANYKKIFSESREIMRDYIDGKKERKNIKRSKMIDFGIICALAVFSVAMAQSISPNFGQMMLHTKVGNILIVAFIVLIGVSLIMSFKVDKR